MTSTTALINGEAVEHAAQLSRELPELGVGMHFVLTFGLPLSPMPGLTREENWGNGFGKWRSRTLCRSMRLPASWSASLTALWMCWPRTYHIDSHHHVHMIPAIFPLVAEFAQRKGVAMRVDCEVRGLPDVAVTSTEGFSSAFYGDEIDEALFLKVLDDSAAKGERSLEVMAHLAFVDEIVRKSAYCWPRLAELDVLTSASLKYAIAERGYRLGRSGIFEAKPGGEVKAKR
ncbi:ChbG/HpnK family deacetylase [Enterobacter hormaechei]